MSDVTRAEIEALTQDDMEFWLGNKFVDPADLIKKVEWWASAVVAARVAAAEREALERAAQAIEQQRSAHWQQHLAEHPSSGADSCPADYGKHDAYYDTARIVRDLMPRKDGA